MVLPIRWPNPACRNGASTMPVRPRELAGPDAPAVEVRVREEVDELHRPHDRDHARHHQERAQGRAPCRAPAGRPPHRSRRDPPTPVGRMLARERRAGAGGQVVERAAGACPSTRPRPRRSRRRRWSRRAGARRWRPRCRRRRGGRRRAGALASAADAGDTSVATARAQSSAAGSTSAAGRTRLARPMRSASVPRITRLEMSRSAAWPMPDEAGEHPREPVLGGQAEAGRRGGELGVVGDEAEVAVAGEHQAHAGRRRR